MQKSHDQKPELDARSVFPNPIGRVKYDLLCVERESIHTVTRENEDAVATVILLPANEAFILRPDAEGGVFSGSFEHESNRFTALDREDLIVFAEL